MGQRARFATTRRWGALVVAALVAAGCGNQATPIPSATSAAASSSTPAPTVTPAAAFADTLRVGWNAGPPTDQMSAYAIRGFRGWLMSAQPTTISLPSVLYSALYRYDAHYDAIPDLADGPCTPQGDGTVIRCRLVETTFHDGTPLTADDVAYSYRVWTSSYGYPVASLKEVRVVDSRTVDFALSSVDPTFLTVWLPGVPIFSQRDLEAGIADFTAATTGRSHEDLVALADSIDEELGRDPPLCTTRLDEMDALFAELGARLYREDFPDANGAFDPCAFMQTASHLVRWFVVEGMGDINTEYDAAMAALAGFAWFRPPVGTGPYRLVSQSADRVHLEAWAGYHGGVAATKYIDFVPTKADGSDVEAGTVDIFQWASVDSSYLVSAASRGVAVATPPANGYIALFFNVRAGQLFAERSLRQALQLCIDLPRDVDAATAGSATPVYGPVLPGSWADDPSLPKPLRDAAAAKQLIEEAGWTLGTDGVYAKNGARLAADIVTRAGRDDRIKMADLIAQQARECGMELRSRPVPWDEIINGMLDYPFSIPGTSTPFDLYIGGWSLAADPAEALGTYVTSAITDAEHNDWSTYPNFGGFSDPAYDRLVEAGKATYDQAERTRVYRQAQQELAAQLPAIFLWNGWSGIDVIRSAVTTVDGPLDLTAPNYAWRPERLVVAASP